jgi:hypothetical protein
MASRKTQQEIDKTFKKVSEGIQTFEGIYEKIRQATNPTQRDKLEDNLKREIKKLQRFRDQIKSWAAGNEVKDKAPLIEQRKAIEVVSVVSTFNADPPWVDLANRLSVYGTIQGSRKGDEDESVLEGRSISSIATRPEGERESRVFRVPLRDGR